MEKSDFRINRFGAAVEGGSDVAGGTGEGLDDNWDIMFHLRFDRISSEPLDPGFSRHVHIEENDVGEDFGGGQIDEGVQGRRRPIPIQT